jgi:hypothetical protein
MFLSRWLSLSFFLHAFFFALLFFRISPQVEPPLAVFVELPSVPSDSPADTQSPNKPGRNYGRGKKAALPKGWAWNLKPKVWEQGSSVGAAPPLSQPGRGDPVYGFAAKMDLAKEGKFHPFARKLYERIDTYLGYPPDFVEENLEGFVTLHFLVNAEGKFLGKFLEVEGDQRILNIYAMAMVALALKEPLENVRAKEGKEVPVALRVDFRLLLPDEYSTRSSVRHFKNTLSFERIAFTEPKSTKKMRRIIDKYLPPIIPVPGGFFVDLPLLYKRLTDKDSDDPDWKRGIRMELDGLLLEQVVRKATS